MNIQLAACTVMAGLLLTGVRLRGRPVVGRKHFQRLAAVAAHLQANVQVIRTSVGRLAAAPMTIPVVVIGQHRPGVA